MVELFGRDRSVIPKHLRNVFKNKELEPDSVCAKFAHSAADGKTCQVEVFNLAAILSVGLLAKTLQNHQLVSEEGRSVHQVVERYTRTWRLLLEYDQQRLATAPSRPVTPVGRLGPAKARAAVNSIRCNLAERGECE